MKAVNLSKAGWMWLPIAGILVYIVLYVLSAARYPGGSQVDTNHPGFDWLQNYWCDLLDPMAMNGQPNAARPFAIAAMAVLLFTLASFWFIFPRIAPIRRSGKLLIQVSGVISMTIALFLSTELHDVIISVATCFGLIAFTGTLTILSFLRWRLLFWSGITNVLLIALNNVLYYSRHFYYLPLVQKLTFVFCLTWFLFICIKTLGLRQLNRNQQHVTIQ